ncbi:MAG: hypothetical protein D6746_15830 [Bacteroidetes bacterium]|nr:MAG: hypothetical protein D6746_15830 [Bacteroidota bacterium]
MRRGAGVIAPLPVVQVASIPLDDGPQWLVEGLWAEEGVGIVGGAPKCCKTWLALDLALSVASGTPALETFAVPRAGPVLLFAAEDRPPAVRQRLEGVAGARGLDLARLPLHAITAPSLRLDLGDDRERLTEAVVRFRPRLLVLDPFVRLQRIDENSAQEVSRVLAYLRALQREQHVGVLVVHHARKAGAGAAQAGQALRGSGDFHAWGESNLYLRRRHGDLELLTEHRNAPATDPLLLELVGDPPRLALKDAPRVAERGGGDLGERVLTVLRQGAPLSQDALRGRLRVRMQRLVDALRALEAENQVSRSTRGWTATNTKPSETEAGSAGAQPAEG